MAIKRGKGDSRSEDQKRRDTLAMEAIEKGEFLRSTPAQEKAAADYVTGRYEERRKHAAILGLGLGEMRRVLSVTQEDVAEAIGTQKSNVSRMESGRYGGITVERVLAVIDALAFISGSDPLAVLSTRREQAQSIRDEALSRWKSPRECLEAGER